MIEVASHLEQQPPIQVKQKQCISKTLPLKITI